MNENNEKEIRKVTYDKDLKIEAYRFCGIMQKFPNHFHDYYVIGFIEKGKRHLSCKNKEYIVNSGDMVIFNPGDNHTCEQVDNRTLDYRCLNIKKEVMESLVKEITGKKYCPSFVECVYTNCKEVNLLHNVHEMIMEESTKLKKEESYYLLMMQLIENYCTEENNSDNNIVHEGVVKAGVYMQENFTENITLEKLSEVSNMQIALLEISQKKKE